MDSADRIRGLARRPIVVAPMAGGPSTPALVVAAGEAGALGFLAAGYKTAPAMADEIRSVRTSSTAAFGVNVFVPGSPTSDPDALHRYVRSLDVQADELGVAVGVPAWDDDDWQAKLDTLVSDPPPLVSFTFGCPPVDVVRALQAQGTAVAITVTTPAEAALSLDAGVDCLCVQGSEAGAHRGSFTDDDGPGPDLGVLALTVRVRALTDLPLFAAGGVSGPRGVADVLAAGATHAQVGTAVLRCPESGANAAYKAALADPRFSATAVTRAFSGRRARGLVNRFMLTHGDAPSAYPEINNATRPLRAAAAARDDPDHMSLYAGERFRAASDRPAAEIIERLAPVAHDGRA